MVNFEMVSKNPEKFDFRCSEVIIKPRLEIIDKTTGKTIAL